MSNLIKDAVFFRLRGLLQQGEVYVRTALGEKGQYGIRPGYRHRREILYFDDTSQTDGHQREVYKFAAEIMETNKFKTVYDIGCGSGYKLVNYLGQYETTWFDLEATVKFLKEKYPQRNWQTAQFSDRDIAPADLVICSDVIEHVPDPDSLLSFLESISKDLIIISTPARDLIYKAGDYDYMGPPRNSCHIREWSFKEFSKYISSKFRIIRHEITNRRQATQMILCSRMRSQ